MIPTGYQKRFAAVLLMAVAACSLDTVGQQDPATTHAKVMRETGFVMSDGTHLAYRVWQDPAWADGSAGAAPVRGVVVALHGAGAHSRLLSPLGEHLTQAGFVTYAYDQRGHGRNDDRGSVPGASVLVRDLAEVLDLVSERHPGLPVYAAGVSMGGSVILAAAESGQLPAVDGIVLLAPGVDGWQIVPWHLRLVIRIGARLAPNRVIERPAEMPVISDNDAYLRALENDPLVVAGMTLASIRRLLGLTEHAFRGASALKLPTLLLYGQRDVVVSSARLFETSARISGPARTIIYPDGYHELIWDEQRENVLRDITAWLSDRDGAIPSLTATPPAAFEYRAGKSADER